MSTVWVVRIEHCDDAALTTEGDILGVGRTKSAARYLAEQWVRGCVKDEGDDYVVLIDGDCFHGDEDNFDVTLAVAVEEFALIEDEGRPLCETCAEPKPSCECGAWPCCEHHVVGCEAKQ
jgi:hypothetical protein